MAGFSNTLTFNKAPLSPYKGVWTNVQIKHLLKRTMFGATHADVEYFASKNPHQAVRELVYNQEETPKPPLNYYNEFVKDMDVPEGKTWVNETKKVSTKIHGQRRESFKGWWLGQMLNQKRSVHQKMIVFWYNHFSTQATILGNSRLSYNYFMLIHTHSMGNFRDMLKTVTLSPAMLKYLNGNANTANAPDENYARELQELFTVGKGAGSRYTEDDIKAAARILTGYSYDSKTLEIKFSGKKHDVKNKKFSSFYGNKTIAGRTNQEGRQELDELLNMLLAAEETSKHLCRKLYRYFIHHEINEAIEENVITPLAQTFRKSNYDIKSILYELIGSKHFFDDAYMGATIKSPLDFTVGLCREFGVKVKNPSEVKNQYSMWSGVKTHAARMQQNIADPPNVAGWPAYYQSPQFDKAWINADTLRKRNIFTDKIAVTGLNNGGAHFIIDVISFASSLPDASDPDKLIRHSAKQLYMVDIDEKQINIIKDDILLNGLEAEFADKYWLQAWQALTTKPNDLENRNNVEKKLRNLYKYLMNLPHYQLT